MSYLNSVLRNMRKSLKFGVLVLLGIVLPLGAISCSDNDPDYNNVALPTVNVKHSISGRVTGISGEGLSATVSLNGTPLPTQADGTFVFENLSTGTYTLKAEASGKVTRKTTVTIDNTNSVNPVWNVTLSNEGTEILINPDGPVKERLISETLKGNESGEIEITLTAPSEAVPAGNKIIVTPLYSLEEATDADARSASTKATESTLLIGTKVKCSDASATLRETITLEYDVDPEIAKTITVQKYVGNEWTEAGYTVTGGKVSVIVDQFTSYSLLCNATVNTTVTSEPVMFTPDSWDNLYGSGDMYVSSAAYSYKIGTEISSAENNKINAYLIEIVARTAGSGAVTATGTYPIDVTLPVGTAMSISGQQEVITLTASALGHSVSGKQYGTVSVVTDVWNRQHTGGSGGSTGL